MKNFYRLLFLAAFLLSGRMVFSQTYQQVWSDEFNGSIGPDWTFETGGGGWGNNELEYYQAANATISNGNLVITARQQSVGGENYTSARMNTASHRSWTFGKVEASIKVPSVSGLWPAFWMLGTNIGSVGWPSCGEIDIMEQVNTSTTNYGTIHWNSGGHVSYGGSVNTSGGVYHNYSIIWTSSAITWYVDGAQYVQANIANGINNTGCFQNSFFIILNMAVGGNFPGNNIGALPASMYVDYVRVSQLSGGGTPPPPTCNTVNIPGTIQAENYCSMSGVQLENTTDAGGGQDVGWIDAGDWMSYSINVPSAGSYTVQYRVASLSGGGQIRLESLGGATNYGTISVPSTGGWQNWTTISQTVNLPAGTQNIAIAAPTGGYNINWFSITGGGSTPPPPPPGGVPIGSYITLKGNNGLFVSSENGGAPMNCNRTTAQAWEKFLVVDAGGGLVALQSGSNGGYVTGSSPMYANATSIGAAQKFSWISPASGQVELKCSSNNLFVSSENGTQAMNCNRTVAQGWEIFTWATSTKSTGSDVAQLTADVALYPMPAHGSVTIQTGLTNYKVEIFDLAGKLRMKAENLNSNTTLSLDGFRSGVYVVRISKDGSFTTRKLVVE